jgi:hypothetical protein
MNSRLEITIVHFDDDVVGLRVTATSQRFAGSVDVFVAPGFATVLANALRGFPSGLADRRSVELGTFDANFGGGGVRLRLRCTDQAGHAVVDVEMRADPHVLHENVSFSMPIEASLVDSLVAQLEAMPLAVGATAGFRTEEPR